jgi:hypothetical protein
MILICAVLIRIAGLLFNTPQNIYGLVTFLANKLFAAGSISLPDYDHVKTVFNTTPLTPFTAFPNHTHGLAAADRSHSLTHIKTLISSIGLKPYTEQMSRSQQEKQEEGTRNMFWAKDTKMNPQCSPLTNEHSVILVDVDYYLNMPNYLTSLPLQPVFLYTFQPDDVSASRTDYSFSFDKDNNAHYTVNGGGTYVHPIWNYQRDTFTTVRTFFKFPISLRTYEIHRKKTSDDHYIIMLYPLREYTLLSTLIHKCFFPADPLVPLKTNINNVHNLLSVTPNIGAPYKSLGLINSQNSARYANEEYAHCMTLCTILKNMQAPSVTAILQTHDKDNTNNPFRAKTMCSLLLKLNEKLVTESRAPVHDHLFPITRTNNYTFFDVNYTGSETPMLSAFMNPIMTSATCPTRSEANDNACIAGRVQKFTNPKRQPKMKPEILALMKKFIDITFENNPNFKKINLCDVAEVCERQSRPSQTAGLNDTMNEEPTGTFTTFSKAEGYGKYTDPRNITTTDTPFKREYSRFTYAASEWLKQQNWYAFGKTPIEITQIIVEMLELACYGTEGDGGRWDGHVSAVLRVLDILIIYAMCSKEDAIKVLELYHKTYNTSAVTKFGVKYNTGTSQGSGVPDTSFFNSCRCHFISIYAKFKSLDHIEDLDTRCTMAVNLTLDIVGGDDNFCVDIPSECFAQAASELGQEFVVKHIPKGQSFTFLSRTFVGDTWHGSLASHCDIRRIMSKFHLTTKIVDVTPKEKLIEKTFALYLTDRNTPIVKELVETTARILRTTGESLEHNPLIKNLNLGWWTQYNLEDQFDNQVNQLNIDCIPEHFNYDSYKEYMKSATTIEDILKIPNFDTYEHKPVPNIVTEDQDDSKLALPSEPLVKPKSPGENSVSPVDMLNTSSDEDTFDQEYTPVPFSILKKKTTDKQFHFKRCLTNQTKPFLNVLDFGCGSNSTSSDYVNTLIDLKLFDPVDSTLYTLDPSAPPKVHVIIHRHVKSITELIEILSKNAKIDLIIFSMSLHHIKDDISILLRQLTTCISNDCIVFIREHDLTKELVSSEAFVKAHVAHNDDSKIYPCSRSELLKSLTKLNFNKIATSNYSAKCENTLKTFHILCKYSPPKNDRKLKPVATPKAPSKAKQIPSTPPTPVAETKSSSVCTPLQIITPPLPELPKDKPLIIITPSDASPTNSSEGI